MPPVGSPLNSVALNRQHNDDAQRHEADGKRDGPEDKLVADFLGMQALRFLGIEVMHIHVRLMQLVRGR